MVVLEQVTKVFADGTTALNALDLEVSQGSFTVLLGASGAGKSTLLNLVNGMTSATSGTVTVGGIRLDRKSLRTIQRSVSMIPQQFQLVERLTVLDNVLSGALRDISTWRALVKGFPISMRRRACELIELVGLERDHVNRRAAELSGGQQQRVAIARAFISAPKVVLADEPVSSLDPVISRDILSLLKGTASQLGATVLCSLHQVDLARAFSDRIVGMREGRIEFEGATDASSDALARLYEKENLETH